MAKTRHIQRRMSQRAITNAIIKIVRMFGFRNDERVILNRKACDEALHQLEKIKKDLIKAKERGGFILIEDGDVEITVYDLNSYSRKKARNDDKY